MIVRIFSDGQYRIPDGIHTRLHELDDKAVAAVDENDPEAFRSAYETLLALIHDNGERLPDDALEPSDLMLPPADISLEEARSEFTGEGLIPD